MRLRETGCFGKVWVGTGKNPKKRRAKNRWGGLKDISKRGKYYSGRKLHLKVKYISQGI